MLVADHDRVQVRQLLRLEGDRLALVVEGALGEPGVGEHGHAADLDQVAAVGDPGDDERLGPDCSLAAQTVAIEKGELTGRPRQRGGLRPRECAAGR